MWPFTRKKSPRDQHDGYEPPVADVSVVVDPWAQPAIVAQMEARVSEHLDERERLDGWKNELTGVGDFMRDKSLGGRRGGLEFEVNLVTNVAAEARWRGSDLGARVVETIPDEMTREGWDVEVQPSEKDEEPTPKPQAKTKLALMPPRDDEVLDAFGAPIAPVAPAPAAAPVPKPLDIDDEGIQVAEDLDGILETLGADASFWQVLCYERGYGGGAILVGANDGMSDLARPLDEKRIKSVDWLNVLSGGWDGEVVAWSYYQDPTKPNYGMPETYMVRNLGVPLARIPAPGEPPIQPVLPPAGATVWWVHESRLLLFSGTAVSHRARVQMRGWGDSVFARVDEVLQQYGQTWGGIANLMTDFSQAVLSIKGLAQSIAGNKGVVSSRALQMNISRSIARILLIDSEEEFRRDTVSLAGVAEVLEQFALRLAAAAGLPLSLLMGQVQGGLGDASAGDIRYFYDRVASWQRRRMLPQLRRLIKLILLSKDGPTGGVEPERWSVRARPLYQMSAKEKSEQYLTMAQGDHIYYGMGAASAEEVAAKRFGGSDYDAGPIVLDLEGRSLMGEVDPLPEADPNAPVPTDAGAKLSLPPQMVAGITKVNEARAKMGYPEWGGPDGDLSVNEFMAKHSGVAAQAANAQKGVVGAPQSVEEQAAAKAEAAKAAFGQKPGEPDEKTPLGKGGPPPATAMGENGKAPATEELNAPPSQKKGDEFDPGQPREENGKWSEGGGGAGGGSGDGGGSTNARDPAQHKEHVAAAVKSLKDQAASGSKEVADATKTAKVEASGEAKKIDDRFQKIANDRLESKLKELPSHYREEEGGTDENPKWSEPKPTRGLFKEDVDGFRESMDAAHVDLKSEVGGEHHADFKANARYQIAEAHSGFRDAHDEHKERIRTGKDDEDQAEMHAASKTEYHEKFESVHNEQSAMIEDNKREAIEGVRDTAKSALRDFKSTAERSLEEFVSGMNATAKDSTIEWVR